MKKLILLTLLIFLDFFSKYIVVTNIFQNQFIKINEYLDIVYVKNFGVSFGLFAGLISPWILVVIGLLVVIFIYYLMISSSDKIEKMGLLIIISGAISNIIDRILNGYVIDFIYLNYSGLYWPAFNFADIYITLGIMMILSSFFRKIKK